MNFHLTSGLLGYQLFARFPVCSTSITSGTPNPFHTECLRAQNVSPAEIPDIQASNMAFAGTWRLKSTRL